LKVDFFYPDKQKVNKIFFLLTLYEIIYCLEIFKFWEQLAELLLRKEVILECLYFARNSCELLSIPFCFQLLNTVETDNFLTA
jgi:hypothetical protein